MKLSELNPPIIELPAGQRWHRVQLTRWTRSSVRRNGFNMPPFGTPTARFDLHHEPVAYLADSAETALYETSFRREAGNCAWQRLVDRSLVAFETRAGLRLVVLRGFEERFPVLQSERYESTRSFAHASRSAGHHGILYASAQHASHSCICLFEAGLALMKKVHSLPLVKPNTEQLLGAVVHAARGSQVPIVR
ncbi:MAG: RES family NAD+ phosphorylase [Variovorax sp.]